MQGQLIEYKATSTSQLQIAKESLDAKNQELEELKRDLKFNTSALSAVNHELSTSRAGLQAANQIISEKHKEIEELKGDLRTFKNEFDQLSQDLATARANNEALNEKLNTQKVEMEAMGKKFNVEFENIANKILETKTEKFTELNKPNLYNILEPLGNNIIDFKKKVEEVYEKESKERFSLGEKVKELAQLNQVISDEARNLTRALKGEAKTQGRWGEMILESILEKSGLVKGREYFMEHELTDENGNPLKSDAEGRKMRPDAVIKYPDNRSVIIDSKVSLNAFTRSIETSDPEICIFPLWLKAWIIAGKTRAWRFMDGALCPAMFILFSERRKRIPGIFCGILKPILLKRCKKCWKKTYRKAVGNGFWN